MATESLMMFMAMQRFSTNDALRAILSISSLVYLAGDAVCSMIGSMMEMGYRVARMCNRISVGSQHNTAQDPGNY